MASILHLWLLLSSFASLASIPSASSNQRHLLQSPQNLQTSFPSIATTPALTNPIPPPPSASQPPSNSSDRSKITKAVVATALSTFAVSFLVFFVFHWFSIKKYKRGCPSMTVDSRRSCSAQESSLSVRKDMVVDEDGLDVLYWRNLAGGSNSSLKRCKYCNRTFDQSAVDSFSQQEVLLIPHNKSDAKVQEIPLLPSGSISSSSIASKASYRSLSKSSYTEKIDVAPPPPPPPPRPPPPKAPPVPPPPPMMKKNPPAPPMPPMPARPPLGASKNSAPLLPHGGGGSSRPPMPVPVPSAEGGRGPTKLKPLHWDKVTTANPDHSMVWDKISDGSFRFDDELMDALFAYSGTNQNNPNNITKTTATPSNPFSSLATSSSTTPSLLDARKSQNFAIVLRSIGISRHLIIDALMEGRGLSHDALEKLSRITPTKEEQTKILQFSGNPTKLSDVDSFLYHLLKTVPSPFNRVEAMLFKSNYDPEILHLKTSIQTLELACKELKSHGLFLKLLEAILKAGNRMNAGTARGNAKAFNLTALCKLSDVKSSDGKTTLLHFVVEEVVRSEGKRLVINRNHSFRRSGSASSSNYSGNLQANSGEIRTSREEKEKEYIKLGLPVVGCLGEELANVKKAATIDYDALVASCCSLEGRIRDVKQLLTSCISGDGFSKEMKGFLEVSEEELAVVVEEQIRVMELVKRTTDYFQPGTSKDKNAQPLQLFVIVRDFFGMFDKVCIDITKKFQKKPVVKASSGENLPTTKSEAEKRPVVRFPNLPPRFMSEGSKSSSDSDSDDGF